MEVGGDFMGIYRLNSDLLMLAQCDISGHGPQASLISFYLRGVVENLINQIQISDGPEDILRALIKKADEQLDKNIGDTQFGTFFFSILSESSN